MPRVLLVTSWGETICGIAAHSRELIAAVGAADPGIEILPDAATLDPEAMYANGQIRVDLGPDVQIIHLNYHAALHSRWTPEAIRYWQKRGWKVIITYHDTGVPNSDQCRALHAVADAFVIHEPAEDLPGAHYWRMGVREPSGCVGEWTPHTAARPILGVAGFDFPWKNYSEVAKVAKVQGWGMLICCPEMTPEREAELRAINPWLTVRRGLSTERVVDDLQECSAFAACFVCHNTGQSASILLGVAARKPVIALSTCRQMRALYLDPLGRDAIHWCETFEQVGGTLREMTIGRFDPMIVALAEQESWERLGRKYADLYRKVIA